MGKGGARLARTLPDLDTLRALDPLLDFLWPRHCLACNALQPTALWGGTRTAAPLGLCGPCFAHLVAIEPRGSCRTCARPLPPIPPDRPPACCAACLLEPPGFDRLTALWRYQPPLREVVQAFKFARLEFLGRHFACALAAKLRSGGTPLPDMVVPVPLPWPRRLLRGFNQTELIAAPLARELELPCVRALRRRAWAPHQTGRRRSERQRASAFAVRAPRAVAGRSVLLVDDVLTTGATVRAASAVLRAGGARQVEVAVVGWTPLVAPAARN